MRLLAAIFICCLLSGNALAQYYSQRYPVIPKPALFEARLDEFLLTNSAVIIATVPEEMPLVKKESHFFVQKVKAQYGVSLKYSRAVLPDYFIEISFDSSKLGHEAYHLAVRSNIISINGSKSGVFYALESLFQLIQKNSNGELIIPGCTISDYPRFKWRGMHLDVARHFFKVKEVKKYLTYMAMYKLNTFHWHLTDDQGWRIEIKKYPLLTSVGAWRNATLIGHFSEEPDRYDSTRYGGFYTQKEIQEVVRFADSLHITVVPEIEMPGHARAILAAYPQLGSDPSVNKGVAGTWGVFPEVLCPKEETFTVLERILDETVQLFPGKYIHIGGDECPKDEWKTSAYCQQLITQNNLKDENGLQSWFVQRIVTYLGTKGKKAIGWDEILEGGLADSAAVMSWRGEEGGIAAAHAHHNVVMTPGSHCYFDHYQSRNPNEPLAIGGYLPLEKVYEYNPVPDELIRTGSKYIMGVQANLWTEYISTFSQVEYMIFPRIAALAEVGWTQLTDKSYANFLNRTIAHMDLYSRMKVNYSRAIYDIEATYSPAPDGNGILIGLKSIAPYGIIRYNYGGFVTLGDSAYSEPILINTPRAIRANVFYGEEKIGSDYYQEFVYHKAMGKSVSLRKQPAKAYNTGGSFSLVDGISGRSPWTGSEWLGWWGDTLDVTIDLGKIDTIHSVDPICLQDKGSWIYHPETMSIYLSDDGTNFRKANPNELSAPSPGFNNHFLYETRSYTLARYVKVVATPIAKIPYGEGAGYPAWLFVSEIIVE